MWEKVCQRLSQQLNRTVSCKGSRSVSGGCIHKARVLETSEGPFFVKANQAGTLEMFQAEAEGLKAIRQTGAIRCPQVYFADLLADQAVLVMEFVSMSPAQSGSMAKLGKQLAAMHKCRGRTFGWHRDNHIGLTPQENAPSENWVSFYGCHRLEYQMRLCEKKGLRLQGGDQLIENLGSFFSGYRPIPSLLHGDLWGGNAAFDSQGDPVLFDPACYYGDREADLAFTEMFGGFSSEFYDAYQSAFPLDEGYAYRKRLYNLYHELNHYSLFGGGYGSQAQASVRYLLSRV